LVLRGVALPFVCSVLWIGCSHPSRVVETEHDFAELVASLSERGAYFDTDNLISNETAYVQVVTRLEPMGGVYVGVGPEQNFHYIGRIRPSWAFILDVRRDNLLHVLVLVAILTEAETPYAYLCELFSRACDGNESADAASGAADWESMLRELDRSVPDEERFFENLNDIYRYIEAEEGLRFALDDADRSQIRYIYRSFFEEQLGLRFRSHGRGPMPHHPSYRQLLIASDEAGSPSHFLSRREDYEHVRELARSRRLVPVVGDFAGDHALRAVGEFARGRGETISAFYLSNVEFYLMRSGSFHTFAENVRSLPLADESLLIRAYFSYGYPHPEALPGHRSTLVRQNARRFLSLYDDGAYRTYWDLSTLDYLP
jgi:hypothetical protein